MLIMEEKMPTEGFVTNRTLVLNAGYEPIQLVTWQRAICLVMTAKAEVISEYADIVRTVTKVYPMPSVVKLKRYMRTTLRGMNLIRCTRKNIFIRDRHECQYCGVRCKAEEITIDHVIPKARGGRTVWDNVVTACYECNRRKGHHAPEQVGLKLRRAPKKPGWRDMLDSGHNQFVADWIPFLHTG